MVCVACLLDLGVHGEVLSRCVLFGLGGGLLLRCVRIAVLFEVLRVLFGLSLSVLCVCFGSLLIVSCMV